MTSGGAVFTGPATSPEPPPPPTGASAIGVAVAVRAVTRAEVGATQGVGAPAAEVGAGVGVPGGSQTNELDAPPAPENLPGMFGRP